MICVDGGQGLLAALPMVYPGIPVHWANKIRNVFDKVSHLASGSYREHREESEDFCGRRSLREGQTLAPTKISWCHGETGPESHAN